MFSSLRFRLWLTYALVVGVVICIAGTAAIIYLLRNPATDRSELQRLRVISAFLVQRSQMFTLEPAGLERPRLEQAVQRADSFSGARIAIYSDQGELLADSRSETQAALPELAFFKTQRLVERPIFRDASQRQWLYVLTPLERGYHLLLAAPRLRLPILAILRDDFLTPFTRGFVLAMVLSLLMAFWIANWITAPLLRMGEAATYPGISLWIW